MFSFVKPTSIEHVSLVGICNDNQQTVQRFHYDRPISIEEECFIAARYSRSDKSVEDILEEIYSNNINMGERAEKIVVSYGHSSVAEFANVNISFEGVSELLALFMLNKINVYAASQRSTRYQEMQTNDFVVPLSDEYNKIYQEACTKGKQFGKDAFDSIRYLLPLATRTSLWINTNLREWSNLISLLLGYDLYPEFVEIGWMLKKLLTEKIGNVEPPGAYLVRHTEPYDYLKEMRMSKDLETNIFSHVIRDHIHSHHDVIPYWLNTVEDYVHQLAIDIGQLRDWNRHRSLIRVIPLIEYAYSDLKLDKGMIVNKVENDKVSDEFNEEIHFLLQKLEEHRDVENVYSYMMGNMTMLYIGGPISKMLYTLHLRRKEGGHTSYRNVAETLLNFYHD